jgi:zinc transport system substrate-binding protein
MLNRWSIFIVCLAVILSFSACGGQQAGEEEPVTSETGKVRVSVTFNAIKEFVEAVGQDKLK